MDSNCKRILISTDTVGGVWTYTCELSRALSDLGVEVFVAAMGPEDSLERTATLEGAQGVTVFQRALRLEWMEHPWEDVRSAREWLRELELRYQPDCIHLNQFACGHALHEAPVLIVAHSCVFSWFAAVNGPPPPGAEWDRYRREVTCGLQLADGVAAVSQCMLRELHAHYGDFAEMEPIPNACSLPEEHCSDRKPWILCAGRLWDDAKNIRLLDEAAPDLVWPVRAAGACELSGEMRISTFRNVQLLGELDSEAMGREMRTAGIFAAPSFYEPFGLSILEAARAGCALVLSDLPSLRANWQGAALFADPYDPFEWKECLNRLSTNPVERGILADAAQARAGSTCFNPEVMAKHYLKHYQALMHKSRVSRQSRRHVSCRQEVHV